jgi:hypothetical protein
MRKPDRKKEAEKGFMMRGSIKCAKWEMSFNQIKKLWNEERSLGRWVEFDYCRVKYVEIL